MELYQFCQKLYKENKGGLLTGLTFEEFVENFMVENFGIGSAQELFLLYGENSKDNYLGMNYEFSYKIEGEKIIFPMVNEDCNYSTVRVNVRCEV